MPRQEWSVIREPVHGDVYLTREELSLLDTPEMQRLRGVRQLGTAYLVFPGATHTRFEHSIGTCHMAAAMIAAINRNAALSPAECVGISPEETRLIRFAALLHDVTHIPFGHNIEDQTGLFERHDSPARVEEALGSGLLGERLDRLGARDEVLAILEAGPRKDDVPPAWKQIISDTICADIFDYLKRDAYYTGLQLGVDARLLNYFKVERRSGALYIETQKRGLLREDVLSEIVRMLEARYYFSERVYYHHAKIAAGALIAKAVESAIVAGAATEHDFRDKTDDALVAFLEGLDHGDGEAAARAGRLLARFRSRRLPKRCGVYPLYANRDRQQELLDTFFAPGRHRERRERERRIERAAAEALGREVDVILYCPARRMQLKEARTNVSYPGAGVRPLSDFAARIPRLGDLEESYRNLWKFYALSSEESVAGIQRIQTILARELEGAVNVYRPGD